jgi:hypothetical protein
MKLTKESFNKTIDGDIVRYSYNCNDTNFYLELIGKNLGRNIKVFKGSLDDRQEELTTKDTLEAWNYFEDLLKVCSGEQGSSGGDNLGKNPQQNPNILPLLAIGATLGGFRTITMFALLEDKTQKKIFDFEVAESTMPQPIPTSVFTVDWSSQDITQLLKCEVILKEFDDVTFEEEPSKKVFLFIPKSISNQGGEEGGNTEKGQDEPSEQDGEGGQPSNEKGDKEPQNKDQKAKPSKGGEQTDEKGEPTDEKGENGKPTKGEGEDTETTDEGGQGGDGEPIEQGDEDGKPSNEQGENDKPTENKQDGEMQSGKSKMTKLDFSQIIQQLADSTDGDYRPSELLSIFRNTESGEAWLATNNFPKIKKDLNLPPSTTPRQFSQQIINSK